MKLWNVDCEQNVYSQETNGLNVRFQLSFCRDVAKSVARFCCQVYLRFTLIAVSEPQVEQHTNLWVVCGSLGTLPEICGTSMTTFSIFSKRVSSNIIICKNKGDLSFFPDFSDAQAIFLTRI